MAEVDTDLEATRLEEEKKAKEAQEKRDKEEKEKRDKAPALGKKAGGRVHKGTILGAEYIGEQYNGIGPLAVPCTRGEQKALTGDIIVQTWIDKPDPEEDIEIIFIIPGEMVKSPQPLTNAEHDSFLKSREEKLEKKSRKAERATASVTAGNAGTENKPPSASTPQTRTRTT